MKLTLNDKNFEKFSEALKPRKDNVIPLLPKLKNY